MPFLVEAVVVLNVSILVLVSEHYLISCAHVKQSSRLLEVAVEYSLYDGFHLGCLDQVEHFQLHSYLKRVPVGVVSLEQESC